MARSFGLHGGSTASEAEVRADLMGRLRAAPIPDDELASNLGLFLTRQSLSRILVMHELYRLILNTPGVVMEFGVRWGQNLSLFQSFRGMYEPYNYTRTIVGFDTFDGFPTVDVKDGEAVKAGDYGVSEAWEDQLADILAMQESFSPIAHKTKHALVKGDATRTIHEYLERQPETVVALAYFDFDIYAPTKACLEAILPRLTRGSVLAFDELNHPGFPGETQAVMETIGLGRYALKRSPQAPFVSWAVVD